MYQICLVLELILFIELRLSLINHELDKISEYTKDISLEQRKYLSERLGGFSSRDITNILTGAIDNHSKYPNDPMTIEEFINESGIYSLTLKEKVTEYLLSFKN